MNTLILVTKKLTKNAIIREYSFFLFAIVFVQNVFAQAPTISLFSPARGPVGASVTITGTNFNATANIVYFGATRAPITSIVGNTIMVTVPTGATYQPISVLNVTTGLTAYSSKPFLVTFPSTNEITAADFEPKFDFTAGNDQFESLAISDLDGDGKPDLVMPGGFGVSIFHNSSSSGSFTFDNPLTLATGISSSSIHVAINDLDGDSKPDLVVTNSSDNTVSILRNTSSPGIISFATHIDFATASNPYDIAISDLDGDGKPDLAISSGNSNKISVLHNTSTSGSVSFAAKVDFSTGGTGSRSVAIGDIDRDGKPDLVASNFGDNTLSVLRNISVSGTIDLSSFATKVDFPTSIGSPNKVVIGDLDGDGKPDLAIGNQGANVISVLHNTSVSGNVAFDPEVDFTTGQNAAELAIGDLDGDGNPDLAVSDGDDDNISVLRNTSVSGTINFTTKVDFATSLGSASHIEIADLDGDGKPDIVTSSYSGPASILRNNPQGVLPLNLVSFNGKLESNQVNLNWQTASEQNTSHFIIEYNTDKTFTNVGTITAAGNSNNTKNYSFTHKTPKNGTNYYRLKMIDNDKHFTYSPVIAVKISLKETNFSVYPNPTTGDFTVKLDGVADDNITIQIASIGGKKVWDKKYSVKEGSIQIKLDNAVSPGEYIVTLTAGNHQEKTKLMVVK